MARKRQAPSPQPLLDKPRLLAAEPRGAGPWVFYGALALLGAAGGLGCFFSAFGVPLLPLPAALSAGGWLAVCLALFLKKRLPRFLPFLVIALWVGTVALFFREFVEGCAQTGNAVLAAYEAWLGVSLPALPVSAAGEGGAPCTVFFCLIAFPFTFFLCWFLIGRRSGWGAFLLTGALVLVPMAISQVPPAPWMAALLLFWACLLLASPALGRRHRLVEERGRFSAGSAAALGPAALIPVVGAGVLTLGLALALVPPATYQRPALAAGLRDGLTQGFGLEAALEGGVGSGNSRVSLDALGSRAYTGETALRVRYQWEDPTQAGAKDYLKSFCGSVYTGDSWERLPRQEERELEALGLHPQNLLDTLYLGLSGGMGTEVRSAYTVEVENVGANPRCAYVPYGLRGEPPAGLEYVGDGFLRSSRFVAGTRQYSASAWSVPALAIPYARRATSAVLNSYVRDRQAASLEELPADQETQRLLSLLEESLSPKEGQALTLRDMDLWTLPAEAAELLPPERAALARQVESYNAFVYDHYTQVPEDLRPLLEAYIQENHLSQAPLYGEGESVSPLVLGQQIAATLAAQCSYTLSPPVLPEGEDFVSFFLFESRQGYCVHFATAATLLFRAAGVPARYAEGYAVPAGEEGWVDVPDSNAHAWVEIYLGGLGWVPVEVTPAGPQAPAASADARPVEEPAATPAPAASPTAEPTPTASPAPEASAAPAPRQTAAPQAAAAGNGAPQGLAWAVVAGALLAVAALPLRRWLLLRRREKRLSQPDRNQAALALYARVLALGREASAHLPAWRRETPPQLEQLALKARFSQHTLSEEELAPFRREAALLEDALRKGLSPARKLWLRLGPVLL